MLRQSMSTVPALAMENSRFPRSIDETDPVRVLPPLTTTVSGSAWAAGAMPTAATRSSAHAADSATRVDVPNNGTRCIPANSHGDRLSAAGRCTPRVTPLGDQYTCPERVVTV